MTSAAGQTSGAVCDVCGDAGEHPLHTAREMMFGQRDAFRYRECASCGCLRLLDVPQDLSGYYPDDYYSFATPSVGGDAPLRGRLKAARAALVLRLAPKLVDRLVDRGSVPSIFSWTAGLGLTPASSLADIGSGNGQVLEFFARNGFSRVAGFDPYLPEGFGAAPPIELHRAELRSVPGRYDLVMTHHAFEHMPDPGATMRALADLVSPGGALLIRTPVADSWAWRHYGVNWVQLDAPRHLHVHTTRSLRTLAAACGLRVHRAFRDSVSMQFWGSELYARDLPLRENEPRLAEIFGEARLREFERGAAELNAAGDGDMVCLVLRAG